LQTASWIAAASFQETSRVLTHAAIRRQVDPLRGYKERIVLGARIPGSTM
jgi:DNA-directed RNA polymerase subunit beta'